MLSKISRWIRKKLCSHLRMNHDWGLCLDCGWSDPNWSAEAKVMRDCPWLDPKYMEAELKHIQLLGELEMAKYRMGNTIGDE